MSEIEASEISNFELAPITDADRVKNTVEDLLKLHEEWGGLWGRIIDREWFEDDNRIGKTKDADSQRFGRLLTAVKIEMEKRGASFSSRGFNDRKFRFFLREENYRVTDNFILTATHKVARAWTLCHNTPTHGFSEHQSLLHEHTERKASNTLLAMKREQRRKKLDDRLSKDLREIADSSSQGAIA
jgi:hypothetical protein